MASGALLSIRRSAFTGLTCACAWGCYTIARHKIAW
jgi:hypothetical protein